MLKRLIFPFIAAAGALVVAIKPQASSTASRAAYTASYQTTAVSEVTAKQLKPFLGSPVCEALKTYPRAEGEKMPWELGEISPICKPFVKLERHELDRCGDAKKDPYSSGTAFSTTSRFTWASRNEMLKKGKVNLFTDPEFQPQLATLMNRISDLKSQATQLCCGADDGCQKDMMNVDVTLCRPNEDPNAPDSCVFGGSYRMSGGGYNSIFRAIQRQHGETSASEFRALAQKNLRSIASDGSSGVTSGSIVLSSYVSRAKGVAAMEPVILHELGHACSMIRMQRASLDAKTPESSARALRAAQWLDKARKRCSVDLELPEAYYDFWEALGEKRELASCLYKLTTANQKQQVDKPCAGLCPGHYLEEAVGVAFSLLLGDLSGQVNSAYPNTCDHVRDGQHPMVSDVADCLTQHSSRFRARLKETYKCN